MMADAKLEKFWAQHIRGWRASGRTQAEYCAVHELSLASLKYWGWRNGKKAKALTLVAARPVRQPVRQTAEQRCVLRGPDGWVVEFSGVPQAGYVAALLKGVR